MMFFLGENFSLFVVYITQQSLRSDRSACEQQPPGGNQESNGWTCPPKKMVIKVGAWKNSHFEMRLLLLKHRMFYDFLRNKII